MTLQASNARKSHFRCDLINPHAGLGSGLASALFPGEDPEAGTGVKPARTGPGKGAGREPGALLQEVHILLSRLSGHTDPQLPLPFKEQAEGKWQVLFPKKKTPDKMNVSWKRHSERLDV